MFYPPKKVVKAITLSDPLSAFSKQLSKIWGPHAESQWLTAVGFSAASLDAVGGGKSHARCC